MRFVLALLAIAGFAAVVRQLAVAALRALRGGLNAFLLSEVANTRAQRGDVTGLVEARETKRNLRGARLRELAALLLWLAALVVPPLTRWPLHIYAAYSALWLLALIRRRAVG
jgi:hypothetical protein